MSPGPCPSCFEPRAGAGRCPRCGWSLRDGGPPGAQLPLGTGLAGGRYILGRVLGQGGFGITYLAWDGDAGARCAIKEYLPRGLASRSIDGTVGAGISREEARQFHLGLEKFIDEARILGQFDEHPNIVSAYDVFEENNTAYMVMFYIEGRTLKQLLDDRGRLTFLQARDIMIRTMDALRAAHSANLWHRDVSPDNIYLTKGATVKLLDFGAARYALSEHSQSFDVILKPGYAPEEQYRRRGRQGPWTDVYATAATLYCAIVGVPPPESLQRMAEDEDPLPAPSELGVSIPPQAERALMRALAIRAEERYPTVEAFQQALLAEVQPPEPRRPEPAPRQPEPLPVSPPPAPPSPWPARLLAGSATLAFASAGLWLAYPIIEDYRLCARLESSRDLQVLRAYLGRSPEGRCFDEVKRVLDDEEERLRRERGLAGERDRRQPQARAPDERERRAPPVQAGAERESPAAGAQAIAEREPRASAEQAREEPENQTAEQAGERRERPAAQAQAREARERQAAQAQAREARERQAAQVQAREERERQAAQVQAREERERQAAQVQAREERERQAAQAKVREERERRAVEAEARAARERLAAQARARKERERRDREAQARVRDLWSRCERRQAEACQHYIAEDPGTRNAANARRILDELRRDPCTAFLEDSVRQACNVCAAQSSNTRPPACAAPGRDCRNGDCQFGAGTRRYDSGNCFVGSWSQGKRDGTGTMFFSNGDSYHGQWRGGERHGVGTYVSRSGNCRHGLWQAAQLVEGVLIFEDGGFRELP